MSADGGSPLDGLWDSISSAVVSFVDAFGWILPALVLTILFLGLIALVAFWLDDLPFDSRSSRELEAFSGGRADGAAMNLYADEAIEENLISKRLEYL